VNGPDPHTGANREATKFRNVGDARSRVLRQRLNQGVQVDDETLRISQSPSNTLVKYTEKIMRSDGTVEEKTLE
jgi:hypothetical protein